MGQESDGDTSYNRWARCSHQKLIKGLEDFEMKEELETIQNTVTQTPVKGYQFYLVGFFV